MEESKEILYGKLSGVHLAYGYVEHSENPKGGSMSKTVNVPKQDTPVHKDLVQAFKNLIPHFMLICQQVPENEEITNAIQEGMSLEPIDDENSIFFPYEVHHFKISGSGENEGVYIEGTRLLGRGGILKLSSPKEKWSGDYKYAYELTEAIQNLKDETYEYSKGKRAPLPEDDQEALVFDEADLTVVED